ncbi:hypothetical protein pb186bvf_006076 [Paramecium bursaria]
MIMQIYINRLSSYYNFHTTLPAELQRGKGNLIQFTNSLFLKNNIFFIDGLRSLIITTQNPCTFIYIICHFTRD